MGLLAFQDNMIFYPTEADNPNFPRYQRQEISLESHGFHIQGWEFQNPDVDNNATLLYFGGNAEDVTQNFADIQQFAARRLFFFNYRGYGKSGGKPSQQALYQDVLNIYDSLTSQYAVQPEQLVVMGRSLGSAVATYVAAHRPVKQVILVTPFDSLTNIAQSIFPFLPVKWFLNHPFPSVEFAPEINTPLLMIVAANDEVIPTKYSRNLYEKWAGAKQWQRLEGVGHNDLQIHPHYYGLIRRFIEEGNSQKDR